MDPTADAATDWSKVSDYFAVVCASEELLEAERDWPSTILANWRETINDVVVVAPKHGEAAPLDYDLIEKSVGQQKADLNSGALYANSLFLAIRKHGATPRSVHCNMIATASFECIKLTEDRICFVRYCLYASALPT
jgi:hypothetical protein